MGERTSYPPGTFCWTELATPDAEGAKAFYGPLFGWEGEDIGAGDGGTYTLLRMAGREVCGLSQTDQTAPTWLSFVSVGNVDTSSAHAAELGARVTMPPFDVGAFGRMALVTDPTGAVLALWQPGTHIGARLVNDPGALCLNQLNTSDVQDAQRFYGALFGWRFAPAGDDQHEYWGITNPTQDGDVLNGGMMPLPPDATAPSHWLSYFTIQDLEAAIAQIAASGGTVLFGPMPIGAGRIAGAMDPQGAVFALFEGRVDP
jgi:uncharacterized protein